MAVSNASYAQAPLNTREPNACSPAQPPLPWTGIVIQAPTRVAFAAAQPRDGLVLPVCGFYRLEMASLMDGLPLLLVAVDRASHRRYAGPMLDRETNPLVPPPRARQRDPEDLKGMLSGSYFNPDLGHYLALPAKAAQYEIHVEYGGATSNGVLVEVVGR